MISRIILISLAVTLVAIPAFGGNCPEFDAVDCDSENYFNDAIKYTVVVNNVTQGLRINDYSDWVTYPETVNGVEVFEEFYTSAGALYPDPCFDDYESALTDAYNAAIYRWRIVLQMKPESDIDLNIVDCVMKHNEFDVWTSAEQTGRYRAAWGQLFFVPSANPMVTVRAIPGPYPTPGFTEPFLMDARQIPGLGVVCLDGAFYTSKALWEEGIVMRLPESGTTSTCGAAMYNLKQGDAIEVTIAVPGNNTADVRYGRDNVVLKYIGIVGTYFYNELPCGEIPPTTTTTTTSTTTVPPNGWHFWDTWTDP